MMQEFASVSSTIPNGSEFLSLNGMVSALRASGRKPLMYMGTMNATPPVWQGIRPADVINRYIDSGIPVIVGLNLGVDVGHAVIASSQVFSHQPPTAANLPNQPTRASFCSAFYVNDDQQGPNLRMPIRAGDAVGETPYSVEGNVQFLIIPLPDKVFLPAEKAELSRGTYYENTQRSGLMRSRTTRRTWGPQRPWEMRSWQSWHRML
ncbi:hypothetical protein AJ88_00840 [Mesorhizobium amorphae CCBAU 01583]|nr:hypothetical protein AJ88_00840 [Mesorhizobium amorphae CCBAU 01583]